MLCRVLSHCFNRSREDLHDRVKARTEQMLDEGLIEETRAIRDDCGFSRTAGAAIGYAECLDHLRGRWKDRTELRNRIRRNTHKLIRRQTTWLRRLPEILRMPPEQGVAGLRDRLEGAADEQR